MKHAEKIVLALIVIGFFMFIAVGAHIRWQDSLAVESSNPAGKFISLGQYQNGSFASSATSTIITDSGTYVIKGSIPFVKDEAFTLEKRRNGFFYLCSSDKTCKELVR